MIATMIALALAGGAQGNAAEPDPTLAMSVRDLNATTFNIGDGGATPAAVNIGWRTENVDDGLYQVNVVLEQVASYSAVDSPVYTSTLLGRASDHASLATEPAVIAEKAIDSLIFLPGSPPTFEQDASDPYGWAIVRIFGGWAEATDERPVKDGRTVIWRFRVQVARRTTGDIVSEQVVDWSRSYGTL